MVFFRRSQAALEFLTTYGWAFLIILVMVGALSYFGVLDPGSFVADRCVVGSPFVCERFVVGVDGLLLSVRNGLGEDLVVSGFSVESGEGLVGCEGFGEVLVRGGGSVVLSCLVEDVLGVDGFSLRYRSVGDSSGSFARTASGTIRGAGSVGGFGGSVVSSPSQLGGLVGYWSFDEIQGNTILDSSGNNNHGTLSVGNHASIVNAVTAMEEGINGVLAVRGQPNSGVYFNDIEFLDEVPHTMSLWIKWDGVEPDDFVLPFGNCCTNSGSLYLSRSNGAPWFTFRPVSDSNQHIILDSQSPNWFDGELRHLVMRVDGNRNVSVFVDGTYIGSDVIANTHFIYNSFGKSSGSSSSYGWNGFLGDIKIYERALSNSEISSLSNLQRISNGLVGEWLLSEGSGSTAHDTSNFVQGVKGLGFEKRDLSEQGILIPHSEEISFDKGDSFSLSVWFRMYERVDEMWSVFFKGAGLNSYGISGRWGNIQTGFRTRTSPSTYFTTTFTPEINETYHIVMVVRADDDEFDTYINGELFDTRSFDFTGLEFSNTDDWSLLYNNRGIAGGSGSISGFVDEPMIFNRALTSLEVQALYNQG